MPSRFQSYADFWPWYVTMHARPGTQLAHFAGSVFAYVCAFALLPFTGNLWWPFIGLAGGYAINWPSHFLLEHNGPATWRHPYWSLLADFELVTLLVAGRYGDELRRARLRRTETARPGARRRLFRLGVRIAWYAYLFASLLAIVQQDYQFFAFIW